VQENQKKILYVKPKLEIYYEHSDSINRDGNTEVWMKYYWPRSISLRIQIIQE
jgi:hypothetical protein